MTKRKNILFIVSRLPINTQTGDRLRVYYFIKKLTQRGHRVDILGYVPDQKYEISTDIKDITHQCIGIKKTGLEFKSPNRIKQLQSFFGSFLGRYPYRVWHWQDQKLVDKASALIAHHHYDVIHFSEIFMGMACIKLSKEFNQPRFVFDLIDSVALSLKNVLKQEKVSLLWPFRFIEQRRLKRFEKYIVKQVDKAILISERDKNFLGLDDIVVIPNGVEELDAVEQTCDIDLLFTGNMAAEANIDAVQWFVEHVFPKILKKNPALNFTIAGANPPASVQALQTDHITVTGFVQNINEYYRRTRLFVCPMRLGAGQKNKILEAMINHTPVLSSTEGNIGVDAPSNSIAIADTAEEFSNKIFELLQHDEKRKKLAEEGYRYVKKNFSWEISASLLEQCYE